MFSERMKNAKTLIFPITGGVGRNIFATAMLKNVKKKYPEKNIFVVAGFPDIFFNNKNIKKIFGFNTIHHFYEDYIDRYKSDVAKDVLLVEVEPYRHPDYMNGDLHIVRAWCDLLEVECTDIMPEILFTRNELDMAKAFLDNIYLKYKKPMIILHPSGGKIPENNNQQEIIANLGVMHRRSLREKTIDKIVKTLSEDGYVVGVVATTNQYCPEGAERICFPLRAVMALLPNVAGIIAIDSFIQHAAAALNVPSLVLWMGTSPLRLGYELHKNLRRNECETPECHRPNSYAFDMQPNGSIWDCPFNDICTDYDAETIINAYKELKGELYIDTVKTFSVDKLKQPAVGEHKNNTSCPVHKH